jgi:hypothetical protein
VLVEIGQVAPLLPGSRVIGGASTSASAHHHLLDLEASAAMLRRRAAAQPPGAPGEDVDVDFVTRQLVGCPQLGQRPA